MSDTTASTGARGRLRRASGWLGRNALFLLTGLIVALAVFAPLIAPQNPYDLAQLDVLDGMLPPGSPSWAGFTYRLGTDDQGRDLVSAILYGIRTSLTVAFGSALISMSIGIVLGLVAAYCRGATDAAIMRLVDLHLAFPAILVALIVLGLLGRGVANVILALVIVDWAFYARGLRGVAIVECGKEYVMSAQCARIPGRRIVFGHVLPNCMSPLMVIATQQIARAIAIEATLSFLGLGVPITQPSLGLLISNGYLHVISGKWWMSVFPGLALFVMIVIVNMLGDHIRKLYGRW